MYTCIERYNTSLSTYVYIYIYREREREREKCTMHMFLVKASPAGPAAQPAAEGGPPAQANYCLKKRKTVK